MLSMSGVNPTGHPTSVTEGKIGALNGLCLNKACCTLGQNNFRTVVYVLKSHVFTWGCAHYRNSLGMEQTTVETAWDKQLQILPFLTEVF